jgi:hypothetical protein
MVMIGGKNLHVYTGAGRCTYQKGRTPLNMVQVSPKRYYQPQPEQDQGNALQQHVIRMQLPSCKNDSAQQGSRPVGVEFRFQQRPQLGLQNS